MPIRYYEEPRYRKLPLVRALFAANLLFAVATLVAWQAAFIHLLGPLAWAASASVTYKRGLSHLFEYPLVLFWFGPALAMFSGWVLVQGRSYKAAFAILSLPLVVMALTFVMYAVVPDAGR